MGRKFTKMDNEVKRMSKVRIVTDSTADLPKHIARELGVTVVPLKVFFGDEEYSDGVDLSPAQFYSKLKTSEHHPRTSQPSPEQFLTVYRQLLETAEGIVSIHISQELSGTVQSARIASEMLHNRDVRVIDSRLTSMVLGLAVIEAARAAKGGADIDQVVDVARQVLGRVRVYFAVDTLEYLKKGGRIGKASAFLGNLLNIKPLLTLEDGLVTPVEKIRGKHKAILRILDKMRDEIGEKSKIKVSVFHADDPETAEKLSAEIRSAFDVEEMIIADLGAVIGTYVGPGTFGATYFKIL